MNSKIDQFTVDSQLSQILHYPKSQYGNTLKWSPRDQTTSAKNVKRFFFYLNNTFMIFGDQRKDLFLRIAKLFSLMSKLQVFTIKLCPYSQLTQFQGYDPIFSSLKYLKSLKELKIELSNLESSQLELIFNSFLPSISQLEKLSIDYKGINNMISLGISTTEFTQLKVLKTRLLSEEHLFKLLQNNKESFKMSLLTLKLKIVEPVDHSSFFQLFSESLSNLEAITNVKISITLQGQARELEIANFFSGISNLKQAIKLKLTLKIQENKNEVVQSEDLLMDFTMIDENVKIKNIKQLELDLRQNSLTDSGLMYLFYLIKLSSDLQKCEIDIPLIKKAMFLTLLTQLKSLQYELQTISVILSGGSYSNRFLKLQFGQNIPSHFQDIFLDEHNLDILYSYWENKSSLTKLPEIKQPDISNINEISNIEINSTLRIPVILLVGQKSYFGISNDHIYYSDTSLQLSQATNLFIVDINDNCQYENIQQLDLRLQKNRIRNISKISEIVQQLNNLQIFELSLDDPTSFADLREGIQSLKSQTRFYLTISSVTGIKDILINSEIKFFTLYEENIKQSSDTDISLFCESIGQLPSLEHLKIDLDFAVMKQTHVHAFFKAITLMKNLKQLCLAYHSKFYTQNQKTVLNSVVFKIDSTILSKLTNLNTLEFTNIIISPQIVEQFINLPNLIIFSHNDQSNKLLIQKQLNKFKRLTQIKYIAPKYY